MTTKEKELIESFNKAMDALEYLRGCEAVAKEFDAIKPGYYSNLIEDLTMHLKEFKKKLYNILLDIEEPND